MTDAANPYAEVRSLVEELTLGAGEVARELLAEAKAAKDFAEKAARSEAFERLFRAVRVGAAWLVRLDEAAARFGKDVREQATASRSARIRDRNAQATVALQALPQLDRLPLMERLRAFASDLTLSDETFAAEVTRVVTAFEAARAPAAQPPARSQAEITAAALAAKRAHGPAPPIRRSG